MLNDIIKSDCSLDRIFLSHSRVILSIENCQFLINFKRNDYISFDKILFTNFMDDENEVSDVDLDIEETLPFNVVTKVKQIFKD